jgi:TPR repeat protein
LGCHFDPARSLHYFALTARQGEAEAQLGISKWFPWGYEGVFEESEEVAFTYAKRAARSGLANAEFAMGYFNEIGMHGQVNLKEAMS